MATTEATFEINMRAGSDLDGAADHFDFTKTWSGGVEGTGRGMMVSAGDPSSGSAGYVALEVIEGTVDGRSGSFACVQHGAMTNGQQALTYAIAPGSGTDELAGITGSVALTVDDDGTHRVTIDYQL